MYIHIHMMDHSYIIMSLMLSKRPGTDQVVAVVELCQAGSHGELRQSQGNQLPYVT